METQTQIMALMKSIENNIIKTMTIKDYDRITSTINSYKEFEQIKDITYAYTTILSFESRDSESEIDYIIFISLHDYFWSHYQND